MADEPMDPAVAEDTQTPDAQDTPTEAPEQTESDSTQEEIDYQKRYSDLQPEYTRATQEAAQYRQIIELAQQGDPEALAILGLESAEQDTEPDEDSDQPLTRAEFEQFRQEQAQVAQEQQAQDAYLTDVNDGIEAIEEKEGRTLTDEETRFILSQTDSQLRNGQQLDVASAYAAVENMSKAAIDRYVNSKKQAATAPLGTAGDEKIDFSDEDARQQYLAQIMDAESSRES